MSVAVSVGSAIPADPSNGLDSTRTSLIVHGSLTLTGSYVTFGDTLDFSGVCSSDYAPKSPVLIFQEPTAGAAPVIYCFLYARGTTQANGLLIVTDFAGAEIPAAAYPAALLAAGANIKFRAEFARNI